MPIKPQMRCLAWKVALMICLCAVALSWGKRSSHLDARMRHKKRQQLVEGKIEQTNEKRKGKEKEKGKGIRKVKRKVERKGKNNGKVGMEKKGQVLSDKDSETLSNGISSTSNDLIGNVSELHEGMDSSNDAKITDTSISDRLQRKPMAYNVTCLTWNLAESSPTEKDCDFMKVVVSVYYRVNELWDDLHFFISNVHPLQ